MEGEEEEEQSKAPSNDEDNTDTLLEQEEPDVIRLKPSRSAISRQKSKSSEAGMARQQLFLVEFLVDTVTIDACSVDPEVLQGQTCLTLTFLNFPPMDICEKDFDPKKEQGLDKVRFNSGKSLMFALNESQCERPPPLMVEITVLKKLEDGGLPTRVEIGVVKICISEIFHYIMDIARFKPDRLPASKSIKDCFMLIGPGKRTMGEVSVYIRMSCLGQNVVTEFQCGSDLKSSPFLFKNREGKKVFEFTGNDIDPEASAPPKVNPMAESKPKSSNYNKPQCGCLPPQSVQPERGGQGDGEKAAPTAFAQGNKVVLDFPNRNAKPPRKGGYRKSMDANSNEEPPVVNPDQNYFVLKVGDKGQIPDRGKMILEFRTPKQKIPPKILPPYHEDIGVQTDSGKKGKGKKGKKKAK